MYTHTSTVALIWTSIHTLIREALSHVCARTHALRLFTHTRYPRPKYNISYSNIQSHVNILFHSHQSADCWFTPTPWLTYGWQTTCLVHTVAAWPYMQRSDMWFCRVFFFQLRSTITQFEKTTSCFVSRWALIGSLQHNTETNKSERMKFIKHCAGWVSVRTCTPV